MVDNGKKVTFRMDDDAYLKMIQLCDDLDMSQSVLIRDAIKTYAGLIDAKQKGEPTSVVEELDACKKQIETMEIQKLLDQKDAEIEVLRARAESAERLAEIERLKREGEHLERENDRLTIENSRMAIKINDLTSENCRLESENADLKSCEVHEDEMARY